MCDQPVHISDYTFNNTFKIHRNKLTSLAFNNEATSESITVNLGENKELELLVGARNVGLTPLYVTLRITLYSKAKNAPVTIANCKLEIGTVNPNSVIKSGLCAETKWFQMETSPVFHSVFDNKICYNMNINKAKGRHSLPNGELYVTVSGTALVPVITSGNVSSEMLVPCQNGTSEDLSVLLRESKYSDIEIFADGRNFSAHKAILWSRSKGFAKLFQQLETNNGNNPLNIIVINDFSADIVEEALCYIYSGKCPKVKDMAFDLLAFARKFEIDGLIQLCESEIQSFITVNNVCHFLDLADQQNVETVKCYCTDFIIQNSKSVIGTNPWNELGRNNPAVAISVFSRCEKS